jgi:ribonuclease J
LASDVVRVISLGGVGEVGKNCTVIETDEDLLLIDTGLMFPEESMHGIDLVVPDFSYVEENVERLRGVILTHGHEDHIGALAYLLARLPAPVPIYGTTLTLGLVASRAREMRVLDKAIMRPVLTGERIDFRTLSVELFHVTHSVPDAAGLIIRTPAGVIVHTGDFKLDPTPVDGAPTDLERLKRAGDEGVLVLLSDSVRAERPGRTPSERVVGESLDRIIGSAKGRVIVTTFASNISRLAQAVHLAAKHGRKVAIAGRSISQNLAVARDLGYIDLPAGVMIELPQIMHLPREQVVLLTTGSQGEPTSVLARIAVDDHPQIQLTEDDTVVIAASPVPGNEETVARTIDNLFRRGAQVIYGAVDKGIHVSGHGSRDELAEMLHTVRPRFAVPMHGEYRHMVLYRSLAEEAGVPAGNVLLPEVGQVMEFTPETAIIAGTVPSGSILVDGLTVGGVSKTVLRERGRLAEDGVLIASLVVDRMTGEVISGPDLIARGFADFNGDNLLDEAKERLLSVLNGQPRGEPEYGFLVQKVHNELGRFIYRQTKRRPMILPVVTEI